MLSGLFAYNFYLLVNGFYLLANNCPRILFVWTIIYKCGQRLNLYKIVV